MGSAAARLKKAGKRKRVNTKFVRMCRRAKALFTTGSMPQASYRTGQMGWAPCMRWHMASCAYQACAPRGARPCTRITLVWAFSVEADLRQAVPAGQIADWMALWMCLPPSEQADTVLAWRACLRAMEPLPQSQRWQHTNGELSATIVTFAGSPVGASLPHQVATPHRGVRSEWPTGHPGIRWKSFTRLLPLSARAYVRAQRAILRALAWMQA